MEWTFHEIRATILKQQITIMYVYVIIFFYEFRLGALAEWWFKMLDVRTIQQKIGKYKNYRRKVWRASATSNIIYGELRQLHRKLRTYHNLNL